MPLSAINDPNAFHSAMAECDQVGRDSSAKDSQAIGTPRVWAEKTIVRDRKDRQLGEHRLGEALWSPQKSADGRDVYANMRDVRPGDVILHLTDNEAFIGVSQAAASADATFSGVSGTEWGNRPCYRIQLRDFSAIEPPLLRDWLLKDEMAGAHLRAIAEQPRGRGLFYNTKLELNQGAYLTAVSDALLEVLKQVYRRHTGKDLLPMSLKLPKSSGINETRLGAAVRLFKWIYGDAAFASEEYLQSERNYKLAFSEKWRQVTTLDRLTSALSDDATAIAKATSVGGLLIDPRISNLLPWRYSAVIRGPWTAERARTFLTSTRQLLFESPREAPAVDAGSTGS